MAGTVIITPTQEDLDEIREYRIGQWKHYKNYECIHCQYSTIYLEKIKKHVDEGIHDWCYPSSTPRVEVPDSDDPEY